VKDEFEMNKSDVRLDEQKKNRDRVSLLTRNLKAESSLEEPSWAALKRGRASRTSSVWLEIINTTVYYTWVLLYIILQAKTGIAQWTYFVSPRYGILACVCRRRSLLEWSLA
jgi:hypothetical protein